MIERLRRSLSFRLLAIFLVLALIFVYGATAALRWIYQEDELRELVSGHLSLHIDYVRKDIGSPPNIDRAIAITEQVPVDIRIAGPDINWASNDAFPLLGDLDWGASTMLSGDPDAWLKQVEDVEFAEQDGYRFIRLNQGPYAIVVTSPRIGEAKSSPDLVLIIVLIGLLWLFFAYVCVRWLFKPIGAIRKGASRIGMGEFDYRISAYRNDQLGDLAEDINKLASDVHSILDAKRQLLLGISHELRSPLSRLRLSLEFLGDASLKEQIRDEVLEMESIIATLLEAERLNSRHAALARRPVDIGDVVDDMIEKYFARDRERIRINPENCSIIARVDEARITLLLKNLVSNALRYSGDSSSPVEIDIADDGTDLVLTVSDYGPGFAPGQADHLGEPFYRADQSRTRGTGGTGLGLYLAKMVADAHGGSLRLDPDYTEGARLVVRIPFLKPDDDSASDPSRQERCK
ncbi:MAG: HAMP domain-containing histidine kinase [Gammaproteobacteria bacterium]|nr:HAMP domain-containing histidine kinase [Gammaproteobacteria bacterium]